MAEAEERRRRPGRPREDDKHRAILAAGLRLFAEGGLERASIDQIARQAGVTRATIYRRWSSREALVADALGELRARAENELGDWSGAPLGLLLRALAERAPVLLGGDQALGLIAHLVGSGPTNPRLLQLYWATYLAPSRAAFGKILEAARDEGRAPAGLDPEIVQDMLAGALLFRFLVNPQPADLAERRAYIVRVIGQLGLGPLLED